MSNRLTVAYVRLSKEDINKFNEFSSSIYNQLAIIQSYTSGIGLHIDKEYIDDGYSGVNFDRPAFEKKILKEELLELLSRKIYLGLGEILLKLLIIS